VPALCLVERDRRSGSLDEEELECAHEVLEVLLAELPESAPQSESSPPPIECLPAHAWGDALACRALAQLLQLSGSPARARPRMLTAELVEAVANSGAPAVCIWSLDSFGNGALRHLVLRIRRQCPQTEIVVGVCGDAGARAVLGERLAADKYVHLAGSLGAAHRTLLELVA
jgi:hypothetical protein